MAYEYERDEWRAAMHAATDRDLEAARDSRRAALGIIGDPTDDLGADLGDLDGPDEAA